MSFHPEGPTGYYCRIINMNDAARVVAAVIAISGRRRDFFGVRHDLLDAANDCDRHKYHAIMSLIDALLENTV